MGLPDQHPLRQPGEVVRPGRPRRGMVELIMPQSGTVTLTECGSGAGMERG